MTKDGRRPEIFVAALLLAVTALFLTSTARTQNDFSCDHFGGVFVDRIWRTFHVNTGENSNWKLVSVSDNASSGGRTLRSGVAIPWMFATASEITDYGDFHSTLQGTAYTTLAALDSAARSAAKPKGNR